MDLVYRELTDSLPTLAQALRILFSLSTALVVGAIIGYEREKTGKSAGLRTHMMVSSSCALFVLGPAEAGMSSDSISRVIQGVAAGIGFIGAGAIIKRGDEHDIKGLTTAAGIWFTAAAGLAAGLGRAGLAIGAAVLAWIILRVIDRIAVRAER